MASGRTVLRQRRGWMAGAAALAGGGLLAVGVIGVLVAGPSPLPPDVRMFQVASGALGRPMDVQAWVPPGTPDDARLPVVVLIHGAGGDAATWFAGRLGDAGLRADAVATELMTDGRIPPAVLVAADIDDSYGVDSAPAPDRWQHGAYATYLQDELLPALADLLPITDDRAGWSVAGVSMGGFAALHLALRAPGLVGGVAALSPAIWVEIPADRAWIQAPDGDRAGHDPLLLATTAPLERLHLFLGRGDRDHDWIIEGTDALADRLAVRGIDAGPVVVPGGHDVSTWRALTGPMLEALVGAPTARQAR